MIRFFIDHPVVTWMVFGALMVSGVYALPHLDLEAMPETELPSLSIRTDWVGASPRAMQRSITVPIEEAARRVHGVEKVTARSYPGRSSVEVAFRRNTNLEFARLELAEQLGAVRRELPAGATPPQIIPFVPEEFRTDDFFTVSLVSSLPTNDLRDRAETWIVPRLLAVPGVADVQVQGGARPLIRIYLDLELVERFGLTADAIYGRLATLDDILPAGSIRRAGSQFTVSVRDPIDLEALGGATLRILNGQPITLDQVARIEPGFEDPSYFVRIDGKNVVQATVARRSGENSVAVSRALRHALPEIQEALSFPVSFEVDHDLGRELEEKLEELVIRSLAILGLLFALLAFALRRVRITAIVVASILLAIVICLSLFYFAGISVNFITISGLTVCFGMLLDNSILVLDAIHRRLAGEPPREALIRGAHEVAFPILATTFTTVVAFLSFTFLSGRLSLYYGPLAASVGIAMLASIFVAFAWIPTALRRTAETEARREAVALQHRTLPADATPGSRARALAPGSPRRSLLTWSAITLAVAVLGSAAAAIWKGPGFLFDHWAWWVGITAILMALVPLSIFVERITVWNLRFWWIPVVLTVGLFAGAFWAYGEKVQKGGFWQQGNQEELRVYIERPVGTDVLLSTETIKLFEAELTPLPEGISTKSWSVENRALLRVMFEPHRLRSEYPELYRNRLILLAEELGGMFIFIGGFGDPYLKGGMGGGLSNSLVKVTGYNSRTLDEIAQGVITRLERNRRVRNVRLSSGEAFERAAADETIVRIRRERLSEYGLTVGEVLGHLRRLLGIEFPWRMILGGEDQRLQLAYGGATDIQYDQVADRILTTAAGRRVRLGDLVELETRPVLGTILREDQRYSMQINWEYIGTDRMRQQFIEDVLAGIELPYGYTAEDVSGQRITREEEEELQAVLWLTLLFIFMTLAALFESFALPILVLLAAPMALVGVVALFWATGATFDSSARIGLVLLFGIVVNNAILLISRFRLQIRELVGEGRYPSEMVPDKPRLGGVDLWRLPGAEASTLLRGAIGSGMRIQLRSILLTSGTTVVGLLPLLVRVTERTTQGKDIWENLALSTIGGLVSSTVLIIAAIPVLYWISVRLGWFVARRVHSRRFAPAPEPDLKGA